MFVCCDADVQDDFAPPVADMPGQFPVYLRLPYRKDSYFCFRDENSQAEFISVLSDCIRHQNKGITFTLMKPQQEFMKMSPSGSCGVKKYISLYLKRKHLVYSTDFLKKKTCEVKAFLKAIQLYRQENGQYESWDMLIGSDVRVSVLPLLCWFTMTACYQKTQTIFNIAIAVCFSSMAWNVLVVEIQNIVLKQNPEGN